MSEVNIKILWITGAHHRVVDIGRFTIQIRFYTIRLAYRISSVSRLRLRTGWCQTVPRTLSMYRVQTSGIYSDSKDHATADDQFAGSG